MKAYDCKVRRRLKFSYKMARVKLGGTAAVFVKECLDVINTKPVVTAFANAIDFEHTNLAPQSEGIGIHMKQIY
jgi:hypothetical protein